MLVADSRGSHRGCNSRKGEILKEVVIVPTFARDPLLYLCLEAIRREDPKILIVVFSDRNWRSQNLMFVCEKFRAHLNVRETTIGYGNSYNLIEAMRFAVGTGFEIVHVIEDDTILHGTGYFDWARQKLALEHGTLPNPVYACALGRKPADLLSTWYTSPIVSWDAARLTEALEKVPLGYFANSREEMQKAVDAAFPQSRYRFGSAEQDGFFLRALEFFKWKSAYPEKDFASHLGIAGYNSPPERKMPDGTLEEQVTWFRKLLYDRARRTEYFGASPTDREMEGLL